MAMEQKMQQVASQRGVRSVVIRAGDFFGSGSGSWFDRVLAKDITRGKMTYPGALDVPTAWAYLPDLANAFAAVADQLLDAPGRFAPFEAFHFQGHTLSGRDWAGHLSAAALNQRWLEPGQSLRIGSLPWPIIKAGGLLVPMWRELSEMRYLWQTPHALDGSKLAALTGPEPHTPLSVALQQTLQELGLHRRPAGDKPAWA